MTKIVKPLFVSLITYIFLFSQFATFFLCNQAFADEIVDPSATQTYSDGTHIIDASTINNVENIIVSSGTTAVFDIANAPNFTLSGNFTNSGNVYFGSSLANTTDASLAAANIFNQSGGLISTIFPTSGIAGFINLANNLNLNLTAVNDIINSGIISSANNLSMTAGGSIQNIMGAGGVAPMMQAMNAMNLQASQIINQGMIQSLYGNINVLSSLQSQNIFINNTQGTMEALNGVINIRDALYSGTGNLDMVGGDFLSEELNLYSGLGAVNASIGEVTGTLSTYADAAHIVADTPMLVIGNSCIIGDPLWASTGSLQVNGFINTGQGTAIIAGGDITSGSGGNSASFSTASGNLWLVAGANITNISGTPTGSPITNGAASVTSVTFQFDNTHGGNIDFTPSNAATILDTSSGAGGNVTLLANSNSSTTGNIWFPTLSTTASTNGVAGAGGNVLIVAGGKGGTSLSGAITQAIQLGQIQTAGTTNSGTVNIATAVPTITNGGGVAVFTDPGLTATTTATFGAGATTAAALMRVGNILTLGYGGSGGAGGVAGGNGGSITLTAGNNIQTGNLLSYGGGGQGGYFYGTPTGGAGGNAGAISVTTGGGSITVSGEVNASGGGGGGGSGTNGGAGGARANILLSAPASAVVVTGNIYSYNGGAGGAGALVNAGGGGGSFGGGGGGSGVFDNGGDGGAGGGAGAASGGGGGVGAGVGNFGPGGGGGFNGGGAGGSGILASGTAGSALANRTYGTGQTGGTGGNSPGSAGTPSGSGSTQLAGGGGAGTDGDEPGGAAGSGQTTGGVLTVRYFSTNSLQTVVVGSTSFSQNTTTLTSLDLANATVQANLTTLIGLGISGLSGTQLGGVYTSVTIDSAVPTSVVTLGSFTALNVPNTYTLTFTGFTNSSPTIGINLTGASTTTQATVGGTVSFTNNNSSIAAVTITSNQAGPALTINSTGTLSSDDQLTLTTPSISVAGALNTNGNLAVNANGTITVTGTGSIQSGFGNVGFAPVSGPGSITALNNGSISAPSGIIGFNGGASGTITITGTGTMNAAEINVGNLNSTTLAIQSPYSVVSPFTGTYTNNEGNISITQSSITGNLQVSGSPPPTPPVPSTGSSTTTLSFSQQLFLSLIYLAALQQLSSSQIALLNEQIGTRISTDYTPYGTYPDQPAIQNQFPLQGNIEVERIASSGQALFSAAAFTDEQLDALANEGIVFGPKTNSNFFDLQKGNVLFMPTSNIQVQTKEGLVSIPKGAIAFVMETGNDAAVYDLHDSATSKIKIIANGKELIMSPGTEILMTRDSNANFNTLNPGKEIGVRNIREKDMGNGIKAYIADFTITGSMMNVAVIRGIIKSNDPEHKQATNKLLKNASILADLTGSAGIYKTKQ
jgi:hypothetical protein